MAKVNQAQEPSMEEILASIRRIIADDESIPAADEPEQPAAITVSEALEPVATARQEDSDLTPVQPTAPAEQGRVRPMPEAPPAVSFHGRVPGLAVPSLQASRPSMPKPPAPVPMAQAPAVPLPPMADESREGSALLSPSSDAIVQSAFGNLASTILAGNQRTLEDLVKDMLRPLLKAWLDTNLPPLVEKLVRDEIERVSRGR